MTGLLLFVIILSQVAIILSFISFSLLARVLTEKEKKKRACGGKKQKVLLTGCWLGGGQLQEKMEENKESAFLSLSFD